MCGTVLFTCNSRLSTITLFRDVGLQQNHHPLGPSNRLIPNHFSKYIGFVPLLVCISLYITIVEQGLYIY